MQRCVIQNSRQKTMSLTFLLHCCYVCIQERPLKFGAMLHRMQAGTIGKGEQTGTNSQYHLSHGFPVCTHKIVLYLTGNSCISGLFVVPSHFKFGKKPFSQLYLAHRKHLKQCFTAVSKCYCHYAEIASFWSIKKQFKPLMSLFTFIYSPCSTYFFSILVYTLEDENCNQVHFTHLPFVTLDSFPLHFKQAVIWASFEKKGICASLCHEEINVT